MGVWELAAWWPHRIWNWGFLDALTSSQGPGTSPWRCGEVVTQFQSASLTNAKGARNMSEMWSPAHWGQRGRNVDRGPSSGPNPPTTDSRACMLSCSVTADSLRPRGPDSSVQGILQARLLEWVATSFSRGSSPPRDWTHVSCLVGRFFTAEPPGKPSFTC